MPRKSNTRAAQGSGTIRKKTVTRKGQPYTYWEARVTVGRDPGTGKQIQRSFSERRRRKSGRRCRPPPWLSTRGPIWSRQR